MRLLIAYGTIEGMTARIAGRMAETARAAGHRVDVVDGRRSRRVEPGRYDAILVGGSMHVGGFPRGTRRFVRRNRDALAGTTSGFFSVCMAIASKNAADREAAWNIARAFPPRLGWRPDRIEVIAGALMFSRYGLLKRLVMIRIAEKELGSVDASRDHVFTDWDAVDRFVLGVLELARARAPRRVEDVGGAASAVGAR